MCLKEQQEFFPSQAAKGHVSFSQLELWLPRLFLALYAIYGVGLLAAEALVGLARTPPCSGHGIRSYPLR